MSPGRAAVVTVRTMILALVCISLTCFVAGARAEEPKKGEPPKNLVRNPGFEEIDAAKQLPMHWRMGIWSGSVKGGKGRFEVSSDAHSGKAAAKIRWFEGSKNIVLYLPLSKKITGEHRFLLKFHYKFSGEGHVRASVITHDAKDKQIQYIYSKIRRAVTDWTEDTYEFTTDKNTARLVVILRTDTDGTLFDDVSLVELPQE